MLCLVFFVDLVGSLFFIIHTLVMPFERKFFPPHTRIYFVRINLILFLFPFPIFANYIRQLLSNFDINFPYYNNANNAIIVLSNQKITFPQISPLIILVFVVWVFGVTFKVIKDYFVEIYKFRKFCESLKKTDITNTNTFKQIKQNLALNKKIRIFMVDGLSTPYVTGIIRPKLFFPESFKLSDDICEIIIRHELAHLKHHDLIFQKLSLAAIIIHWYNPITYLLFRRIIHYDELYADETALNQASYNERLKYGKSILQFAFVMHKSDMEVIHKNFITNEKNSLKERIEFMKNTTIFNNPKQKVILTIFLTILMLLTSFIPIIAYANPSVITDQTNSLSNEKESLGCFSTDVSDINVDTVKPIIYDGYFVDIYGNFYEVSISQQRYLCNHSYISGTYTQHIPHDDGSCISKQYKARRCKYCSSIILDELYSTTTYLKCPH